MSQERGPTGPFYFGQKEINKSGSFDFLSPVLSDVNPREKTNLMREFDEYSTSSFGERSRRVLISVLYSSSSKRFKA